MKTCKVCNEPIPNHVKDRLCAHCRDEKGAPNAVPEAG